jgi:hypothetical protein
MARNPEGSSLEASDQAMGTREGVQDGVGGTSVMPQPGGPSDVFGDHLCNKKTKLFVSASNFSGFSAKPSDPVDDSLRQWINDKAFDIFGVSETNLYWPNVPKEFQLPERISGWWNPLTTRMSYAYNYKDRDIGFSSTRQYGGVSQFSLGAAALKFQGSGQDPRGLGRWTWHLFKGKHRMTLRVVTAYRPCKKDSSSTQAVYSQHCKYFNSIGKPHLLPRKCILDDLAKEVRKWHSAGEQVVLMMDVNEDVRQPTISQFLEHAGLRDAILSRHGSTNAPPTYITGKAPIDAIFISTGTAIMAGGYASFCDGVQGRRSDHRCLWIDIQLSSVLGQNIPGPVKYAGRRCHCRDPRVVHRFNTLLKEFIIKTGLARRIFHLEQEITFPPSPSQVEEAERIATLRLQGIQLADKGCRKIHMGKHASSPAFKQAQMKVAFWNLALRKKSGTKVNSRILSRYLSKSGISTPLRVLLGRTKDAIEAEARTAYKEYRLMCTHATNVRATWLDSLANARAEEAECIRIKSSKPRHRPWDRGKATSQELKNLKERERLKRSYAFIRKAIGKEQMSGISSIEVPRGVDPEGNTTWHELSNPHEIVLALIQEHKKKYHQTEGTPARVFPLSSGLGPTGQGPLANDVLRGYPLCSAGLNQMSQLLLTHLSRVKTISTDLPMGMSGQDYSSGWKKINERTSSGGSICHFGHCKAMAHDAQLSEMEAAFLSIPMRSGYAYQYWRKGIDCILPKKKTSMKVSDLRTIVLLDASFNFTNKFVSRKVARNAEAHQAFAMEQFGSRKDHRAIDHALNKRLSLDLLRQQRVAGVLCPNDLKGCYDRICHNIASLSMRRLGLSAPESELMFGTLQYLEHSIRSAHGDSLQTYGTNRFEPPMQGVFQGNGCGPVVWAAVSSPALTALRTQGFGTHFVSAISGAPIRFVGYAFVDDTDLIQTARTPDESISSVIQQMQACMHTWEGLVRTTGGALSIDKCCWWAIDFSWASDGSWKYKPTEEIEGVLEARDFDSSRKSIKRLDVSEAFETLGVFLAPDGNDVAQFQKMLTKAEEWASKVQKSFLRQREMSMALKTTILKTLEYPLLTTSLSLNQCQKIMRPILVSALPKSRFNRNFCRRTLFAPGSHLGLDIHQLYVTQTSDQIMGILKHGPANTLTGQLIRGSIELLKVELGLPGPLFANSFAAVGHLATPCWVKFLWQTLDREKIELTEHSGHLQLGRQRDCFIMSRFLEVGFKLSQLARLNKCRIFLQVTCKSCICSGDGSFLLPNILQGHNPMKGSSDLQWPVQPIIPDSYWVLWRRALKKAFPHRRCKLFGDPLGKWLHPPPGNWPTFYCPSSHTIFFRDNRQWARFRCQSRLLGDTSPDLSYTRLSNSSQLPPSARRAIGWISDGEIEYHKSARQLACPPVVTPRNASQALLQLAPDWKWAVTHLKPPSSEDTLLHALRDGTALAITDGSFDPFTGRGAAAFCLSTADGKIYHTGAHETPGTSLNSSAYRSELSGVLGSLLLCQAYCTAYSIESGTLVIGCDNMLAGRYGVEFNNICNPSLDHYDLLQAISKVRANIPLKLRYAHVEGHQREKYAGRPLSVAANLNDRMDSLAKAYLQYRKNRHPQPLCPVMPQEWSVSVGGTKLCTRIKTQLRHLLESRTVENMWSTPKRRSRGRGMKPPIFLPAQISLFDFPATQKAWDSVSGDRRRFVTKVGSDSLPVGVYMKRMGFWTHDECPCCGTPGETGAHLLCCKDPRMTAHRQKLIVAFQNKLRGFKTHPRILHTLIQLLHHVLLDNDSPPTPGDPIIAQSLTDQLTIGRFAILHGRLVKGWAAHQQMLFRDYAPHKSGLRWASDTIIALWELHYGIWTLRNDIAHTDEVLDKLTDMESIDREILEEWGLGPEGLHPKDKYLFRGTSADLIMGKKSKYRREWLQCVQAARYGGDNANENTHDLDDD